MMSAGIRYPDDLPISSRLQDLRAAISQQQILIVVGETGSGKSTQLPKLCLELGRSQFGLIGHTQPRRLAARALANRIATELQQVLGATVGYRVRFDDKVSPRTELVLLTDGLLLAELGDDPWLSRYGTVIVDEAHERSVNIDLLLGVLLRICRRRPEFKLLVTSASLDVEKMAAFLCNAPVLEVAGRAHPVELRHRADAAADEEPLLPEQVAEAVQEISMEPGAIGTGDVLVFLPGESEIRDVGAYLESQLGPEIEVLPLYSRLPWEEQRRIFEPGAKRRVILATNVAETSITVPRIRAVVDTGLARVSRYSTRSRLQSLALEPISQSSAQQRAGRCGRVGPGLCVRLYSEANFLARPAHSTPEVLRTNLAALLLRLAASALGKAEEFPFVDAPDARAIGEGYRSLQEMQALDAERCITRLGRRMAALPVDPRLARTVIEAERLRILDAGIVLAAALSVADPRPQRESDSAVRPQAFEDPRSEFMGLLRLWQGYRAARQGSRTALRRWLKVQRLSWLRMAEWADVYAQIRDRIQRAAPPERDAQASYKSVHRALLTGFYSFVGRREDKGDYLGLRSQRFWLHPGSSLKRRSPRWVMAANIVETTRVYARMTAEIEPAWLEISVSHLLKRDYVEADWDEEREQVIAKESVSLMGLAISAGRRVNYGPIAPLESRRIFSREALVFRRLQRRPDWLVANDTLLERASTWQTRLRRTDMLCTTETLAQFYEERLPLQVSTAVSLWQWSDGLDAKAKSLLLLTLEQVLLRAPTPEQDAAFPETVTLHGVRLALSYRFEPGMPDDGPSLHLPVLLLPSLTRVDLGAAVPGLALERTAARLRQLPKDCRRDLIPLAESAAQFLADHPRGALDDRLLLDWLRTVRTVANLPADFAVAELEPHLNLHLIVEEQGRRIASGDDLCKLRVTTAAAAQAALRASAAALFPKPFTEFPAAGLPRQVQLSIGLGSASFYVALVPQESGIRGSLHLSEYEALDQHRLGLLGLARRQLHAQIRDLRARLGSEASLLLAAAALGIGKEILEACIARALSQTLFAQKLPYERAAFDGAIHHGRAELYDMTILVAEECRQRLRVRLAAKDALGCAEDSREARHLQSLLNLETIAHASSAHWQRLPAYLRAAERSAEFTARKGTEAAQPVWQAQAQFEALSKRMAAEARRYAPLDELRWWCEELRVSIFAQDLRTAIPISAARIARRAAEIQAWLER